LPTERRFVKYQWIDVAIKKASSDPRPESHNIRGESIQIASQPLSTRNGWKARKEWVFPLKAHCMCCLKTARDEATFPTLGFIKPRVIEKLVIEPDTAEWSASQLQTLSQGDLFADAPTEELEKIPFVFKYKFRCDHDECTGHEMSCTDWASVITSKPAIHDHFKTGQRNLLRTRAVVPRQVSIWQVLL